ncbi:MAG TPA: patatin-like phospholipase family protein [Flavobacteriaceae bacterium]|nr:patatin-like phospholipase family protein [Flavobacteriaceae bacterium]
MRIITLLTCLLCIWGVRAQDSTLTIKKPTDDLKVGLVLSGGGAKGFAHIGVLKVLEENGVRVDYIAGTSMGAIVGGLYASGYTANELDSIISKTNFTSLIQDLIPRGAMTFYEKEESERYVLTLPFDRFKLGFPSGISRGQNVYSLLSRLTQHVSDIEDFSKLPIPFLCIATDIETTEEVILDSGSLAQAISASGALPSLFNPKYIDGKLLLDGGIVNNFPVDEIKSKVDIIIGVDVQDGLRDKSELNSMVDVLMQLSTFTTTRGMDDKKGEVDVYMHPDIGEYTVMSFDKTKEIIASGEKVANEQKELLQQISKLQKPSDRVYEKIIIPDSIAISEINIRGNENYTRSYILGKLKLQSDTKVSFNDFDLGIYNLLATRNFSSIDFDFNEQEDDRYIANFFLRESPTKQYFRIAAHYDDVYKTSALLNLTRKRLLTANDIVSLDFIVGDNLRYQFDYYVDKGNYWSYGFNSKYDTSEVDANVSLLDPEFDDLGETPDINRLTVIHNIFRNRLYLETLFKRHFLVGVGAQHKWLRVYSNTFGLDDKSTETVFDNSNYYSAVGYIMFDTLDDTFYPDNGIYLRGDIEQLLYTKGRNKSNGSFSVVRGQAVGAMPMAKNLTFIGGLEAGFVLGRQHTRTMDFLLGGFGYSSMHNMVQLYGYAPFSLRGDSYFTVKAEVDFEFYPKNHINFAYNIANVGDDLFESKEFYSKIQYTGFAIGYGIETFLGPIDIKYSYSPELKNSEFYVVVGYPF